MVLDEQKEEVVQAMFWYLFSLSLELGPNSRQEIASAAKEILKEVFIGISKFAKDNKTASKFWRDEADKLI